MLITRTYQEADRSAAPIPHLHISFGHWDKTFPQKSMPGEIPWLVQRQRVGSRIRWTYSVSVYRYMCIVPAQQVKSAAALFTGSDMLAIERERLRAAGMMDVPDGIVPGEHSYALLHTVLILRRCFTGTHGQ